VAKYKRIGIIEREEISRGIAQGKGFREIARILRRSTSTISREINKNSLDEIVYRAVKAQETAEENKHISRKIRKLDSNKKLRFYVFEQIEQLWSPEQIAKKLKILYPVDMSMQISHESIYSYLYVQPRGHLRDMLVKNLRRGHINRRVKNKKRIKCSPIQDYISIDRRPKEVNSRIIPGHWEGDLIMGHSNWSAMGTLVERKTLITILVELKKKDAASVRIAFAREFKNLPIELKRSLTYDHGQEMAEHKKFTEKTKIKVFFAHPHSPWERSTSENTNGLIRQFFPKGTDFTKVPRKAIKKAQKMLNDRPRKKLGFLTPNEVFGELLR